MRDSHSPFRAVGPSFLPQKAVLPLKRNLITFLSYLLVATLAAGAAFVVSSRSAPGKLAELESLIDQRFIGEADVETMEDAAAAAMLSATGDRWSYYVPASEYEAHQELMNNAYVGVGITIQEAEEGGFSIVDVTEGAPAQEAGLQIGDILVAVAGESVREKDSNAVRDLVRGEEGTYVDLTVLRQETEKTFSVERRRVETVVATGELLEGNIGLVTIRNFDTRCFDETKAAIDALLEEGAKKLIFDVRSNPGGYANELVKVLDYLLPEGEVFHTVDYRGKESIDYSDAACLDVPMVVLVDGNSYSAAEFFAAALQEYEAARVVGSRTVGKGYFQSTFRLSDGSAVALSIGKYYTPKGENLADVGIVPDVEIDIEDEEKAAQLYYGRLPHEEDPQLQAAIQLLK